MPNAISYERVLQIARSLGFSLAQNAVGPALVYRSSLGIVREFTVPWLQQGKFYPDDQVRGQLEGMRKSAPASVSSPDTHKAHSQQCMQKSTHTSPDSPADSDAPKS